MGLMACMRDDGLKSLRSCAERLAELLEGPTRGFLDEGKSSIVTLGSELEGVRDRGLGEALPLEAMASSNCDTEDGRWKPAA